MAKLETFTLEEILQEVENETDWVVEELPPETMLLVK